MTNYKQYKTALFKGTKRTLFSVCCKKLMVVLLGLLLIVGTKLQAQNFMPLWPEGHIPGSAINLKDSIVDERIWQVGTPGMYCFFPAKEQNKGAAVIICPGGGYTHLAYISSGINFAKWLNTIGVAAFVLNYRLPNEPGLTTPYNAPLQDAQRAMRMVRSMAVKWHIAPDRVGIMGTSAGGHLASTLGTYNEDVSAIGDQLDQQAYRPNFMILISALTTLGPIASKANRQALLGKNPSQQLIDRFSNELQVDMKTPPAFIIQADDDKSVNPENSIQFYQALRAKKIPASLFIFPKGGHAFSEQTQGSAGLWQPLCAFWLSEMGFINKLN